MRAETRLRAYVALCSGPPKGGGRTVNRATVMGARRGSRRHPGVTALDLAGTRTSRPRALARPPRDARARRVVACWWAALERRRARLAQPGVLGAGVPRANLIPAWPDRGSLLNATWGPNEAEPEVSPEPRGDRAAGDQEARRAGTGDPGRARDCRALVGYACDSSGRPDASVLFGDDLKPCAFLPAAATLYGASVSRSFAQVSRGRASSAFLRFSPPKRFLHAPLQS